MNSYQRRSLSGKTFFFRGKIVGKRKRKNRILIHRPESKNPDLEAIFTKLAVVGYPGAARAIAYAIYVLGSHDERGWAEINQDDIGFYSGLKWQQVSNYLKVLEADGLIERKGIAKSTAYKIIIPADISKTELKPHIIKKRWATKGGGGAVYDRTEVERLAFQLIDEYKILYRCKYNQACYVTGKDRTKAVKLVRSLGFEESLRRLERYLNDGDHFVKQSRHSFALFEARANYYHSTRENYDGKTQITCRENFEREIEKTKKRIGKIKKR